MTVRRAAGGGPGAGEQMHRERGEPRDMMIKHREHGAAWGTRERTQPASDSYSQADRHQKVGTTMKKTARIAVTAVAALTMLVGIGAGVSSAATPKPNLSVCALCY
ncbi:hypothetical protein GCM10009760_59150 [Kitasatospora kazusensis]|uniref:Uncharacterized protein n=1 Tax=Kitasatospora kazusensis TaxID=407974 RepID=A0ABN3AA20_9ACTN